MHGSRCRSSSTLLLLLLLVAREVAASRSIISLVVTSSGSRGPCGRPRARGSCILSILERRQIDRLCSCFAAETERGWTAAGGRLPFLAPPLIPAGGFHMRFNPRGVVWLCGTARPARRPCCLSTVMMVQCTTSPVVLCQSATPHRRRGGRCTNVIYFQTCVVDDACLQHTAAVCDFVFISVGHNTCGRQ